MFVTRISLGKTLDAFNEAHFFGEKTTAAERREVALWLAGRQGLKGAYANGRMFAPTEYDFKEGFKTFTGEKITSGAATANQLGEEAMRALALLNVKDNAVQAALARAVAGKAENLSWPGRPKGWHCCGSCSIALWRRLLVMGRGQDDPEVIAGAKLVKGYRTENGKYRRLPFWYTALAMSEINLKAALDEIRYMAPTLERVVNRKPGSEKYARRRHAIAERCLAKV